MYSENDAPRVVKQPEVPQQGGDAEPVVEKPKKKKKFKN